jgi:CRISPR type IV-associated DEAD/DEAH-box helicase Csf4
MIIRVYHQEIWIEELKRKLESDDGTANLSPAAAIRRAARKAAESGLPPVVPKQNGTTSASIRMLSSDRWLKSYKETNPGFTDEELLIGAANAYLAPEEVATDSLLPLAGMEKRPQQIELANFLTHTPRTRPHLICEASTGIGKGLALVAAALQTKKQRPDKQLVIAAPTLAILSQLQQCYKAFEKDKGLTYRCVKTQSSAEFLSKRLALYWCDEFPEHPEAESFLKQITTTDTFSLSAFEHYHDIPLSELTVFHDTSTADPGYKEFHESKSATSDADIILCTHTMLALSVLHARSQTTQHKLPWDEYEKLRDNHYLLEQHTYPYFYFDNLKRIDSAPELAAGFFKPNPILFIDEAHALPGMIELVSAQSVSLARMKKMLSGFRKPSAKAAINAIETLEDAIPDGLQNQVALRGKDKHFNLAAGEAHINDRMQAFIADYKRKTLEKTLSGRALIKYAKTLESFSKAKHSIRLNTTPIRKYIRIESSLSSVEMITHFLAYSSGGTSSTSATLHVPAARDSLDGYGYIATQLSLPFDKVDYHKPIISSWLTENVTLKYMPPTPEWSPDTNGYIERCANEIESMTGQLNGGTMVLCTSYDQVMSLSDYLDPNRVITQKPGQSISSLTKRYMASYRAGIRPIWIATGAAWTGLDVTDATAPASEDNAIQSLFILKLPFDQRDVSQGGLHFHNVMAKCLFKLKQGIGRLVRRPGRNNMQVVIFDGRLYSSKHKYYAIRNYLDQNYEKEELPYSEETA